MRVATHVLAALCGLVIGLACSQYCQHLLFPRHASGVVIVSPKLRRLFSTLALYESDSKAFQAEADRFGKDLEKEATDILSQEPIQRAMPDAYECMNLLDVLGQDEHACRVAKNILSHRDRKAEESFATEIRQELLNAYACADIVRHKYGRLRGQDTILEKSSGH